MALTVGNRAADVERARKAVEDFARRNGLADRVVFNLSLAYEELLTNLLKHGYDDGDRHQITIRVSIRDRSVVAELEDDGRPFDPTSVAPADVGAPIAERPVGGLGLHLVRKLMNRVRYERAGGRNKLIMTMKIGPR
jgi:anti-sigma regulatory factor (Ser/Thr protein kinase)